MTDEFLSMARDLDILVKNPDTEETLIYLSRIEGIGEQSLQISPPFLKGNYGQLLKMNLGDTMNACVTLERCSYFFETQMLGVGDDVDGFWEISWPQHVEKQQRRQHVRLEILLDVTLEFFDGEYSVVSAFTRDISAGGVQVVMEEEPPTAGMVRVLLPLAPDFTVETTGEILRVTCSKSTQERFLAAIKFDDLSPANQEKIIKYVFRKEIERRQKTKK